MGLADYHLDSYHLSKVILCQGAVGDSGFGVSLGSKPGVFRLRLFSTLQLQGALGLGLRV